VVEKERTVAKIEYQDELYTLPSAISNMVRGKDSSFGKLTRTRLQLNENEIHTSLLHISPGGAVPEHTHKGFELTVLLEGSFSDEKGEYVKGDFIMLDGSHQHSPVSKNGCLCYTVANDALHFSQGINKLLNPIGTFIY
jgi:putative transcriptional regulator